MSETRQQTLADPEPSRPVKSRIKVIQLYNLWSLEMRTIQERIQSARERYSLAHDEHWVTLASSGPGSQSIE